MKSPTKPMPIDIESAKTIQQRKATKREEERERDGCDAIYTICAVLYCKARRVGKLTVFGSKAVFVRT